MGWSAEWERGWRRQEVNAEGLIFLVGWLVCAMSFSLFFCHQIYFVSQAPILADAEKLV